MKNKEKLAEEIASNLLKPIGLLNLLSFLTLLGSPIIWIWYSGLFALKIALTAMVGIFVSWLLNRVIKSIAVDTVEEGLKASELDKTDKPKQSKFQQRLKEMQEKQKNA